SSEGNDALDGWGSAICSTADHGSVVRLVAACPPRLPAALAVFQAARGPRSYSAPPLLRARGDYAAGELASMNSSISRSLLRRTTRICTPYFRRSVSIRGRRSAL